MNSKFNKQVDSDHYCFGSYYSKERWMSIWFQIELVLKHYPKFVLEVGGGRGVLKSILSCFHIETTCVDIADDLKPDRLGSITSLPASENEFDVACAFQVLEHLPLDQFEIGVKELLRVSKRSVLLSIPNANPFYDNRIHIPGLNPVQMTISRPAFLNRSPLCNEHYWEINRNGVKTKHIIALIENAGGKMISDFRLKENYYHHFFEFRK